MLKNKKFLILLVFILFIFLSLNNVYASNETIEIEYNGQNVTLPLFLENDDCNFTSYSYVLTYCSDGHYWLNFCKENNINKFVYVPGNNRYYLTFRNNNDDRLPESRYYLEDNKWIMRDSGFDGFVRASVSCVIASTSDIYTEDGTIFFPKTSLPLKGVQLLTPMTVEEIPTMIMKLLTILVPVGLTIFGMLLLVYLLHSKKWLGL